MFGRLPHHHIIILLQDRNYALSIILINKGGLAKKYRKAEYVQRRVPSSNVQVLLVIEVVLIVVFH